MRKFGKMALGAIGAALLLSGCTANTIDTMSTKAIAPVATDISERDLAAGKAQFRESNYGLAEKHFRKAVELRADNSEAWMGLAASYDQLGRFDFADRAYDQLVKIAGRRGQIVNNMGCLHPQPNRSPVAEQLAEANRDGG
jgi:Flp pilus assembly protein TadD